MILGYARVSTDDQKLEAQIDALEGAGAERVFADKITGSVRSRPLLDQLIDQLRPGDVVIVTKYDRLARSLKDLLEIVETSLPGWRRKSTPWPANNLRLQLARPRVKDGNRAGHVWTQASMPGWRTSCATWSSMRAGTSCPTPSI